MLKGLVAASAVVAVLASAAAAPAQLADKKVDDGGHLVYLQRIDETQAGSIDVAIGKARTSVLFKRPSKALEDAVAAGRNAILAIPHALPLQGGLPIVVDGKVIGAVGVSGVTSAQDEQVAKAGIDALGK